jgi:hypothetical protein
MKSDISSETFVKKIPIITGFWFSIISVLAWTCLMIGSAAFIVTGWMTLVNNPYSYMTFSVMPAIPQIAVLLCLIVIMTCVYHNCSNGIKIFMNIGNKLLLIYIVTLIVTHCLKYLFGVYAGEKFLMKNDLINIMSTVECFSYAFLALSGFFYFIAFGNNRIKSVIRILFIINALVIFCGIAMSLSGNTFMVISAAVFWYIILPVNLVLFIFHFADEEKKRLKLLENEIMYGEFQKPSKFNKKKVFGTSLKKVTIASLPSGKQVTQLSRQFQKFSKNKNKVFGTECR